VRVAIVSDLTKWAWAGCEELWAALAQKALERGDKVAVYLCRETARPNKVQPLVDRGLDLHLPGTAAKLVNRTRRVSWKLWNYLAPLGSPFATLPKFSPTVLFFNAVDTIPNPILLKQLRRTGALGLPYVIMCQNSHLFDRPVEGVDREEAVRFYQGARLVLSAAERTNAEIQHQLGVKLNRMRVIRNPVNIRDFSVIPMPIGSTVGIASLGRMAVNSKGQDMLLAALGGSDLRQHDWRLSFYGEGPDVNHLMLLAKHYGISDRVSVKGYENDIRVVWAENHLLALPSRVESCPLVMVEAMLCGRTCVANDVGGVTDWISEPDTGFVSPGLNIASFQKALQRAWSAKPDWTAIGMRAHDKAQKAIDPDPGGTILKFLDEISAK
jgi:L-malate glycosyltransferase